MSTESHQFTATIWRHDGPAAWHFVSLPDELADGLRAAYGHRQKAFGSLPVRAKIGHTEWETSIFFDRKRETYLLPVKAAVRDSEDLEDGDELALQLTPVV
ncbi:MAG: DUF1905 domain-containing protein [Thermoleophilaceae bacterium]|nr:DUF1905 domain-containing protein [Thermoleophilaceae bacterium]